MLVHRGMGVLANPLFGDTVPVYSAPAPVKSSNWDRPWQCLWVPGYSWLNPTLCQNYSSPGAPVPPVVPVLQPDGTYSVDQVVMDTSAAQGSQTQAFFDNLATQLGLDPTLCDPAAFWCNYGSWLLFGGVAVAVLFGANQLKGLLR